MAAPAGMIISFDPLLDSVNEAIDRMKPSSYPVDDWLRATARTMKEQQALKDNPPARSLHNDTQGFFEEYNKFVKNLEEQSKINHY
jgi:hypothetical protein